MKLLSIKAVWEIVLYSRQHIARLEKAGHFSKRVRLGPDRVAWIEQEVQDWLNARIAMRDTAKRS